jgi:MFS family permease
MKTPSNSSRAKATGTEVNPEVQDRNLTHLGLIIVFGILATTMPQTKGGLGDLPLKNLMLQHLHASKTMVSSFGFLAGLAWYFKPFAGILTDAFPLFRTRRRSYMMIGGTMGALAWLAMMALPPTYISLLGGAIVLNIFLVITSTVTGAYLVEAGQALAATGRLTALRQITQNGVGFVNGPISGWLAISAGTGLLYLTGVVNAAFAFSIVPIAYIFLREKPVEKVNSQIILQTAGQQLKTIFTSGTLWFALLFIGLFYFAPGYGTVQYFRQTKEFGFTQPQIGLIGTYAAVFGILAAFLYGFLIRRVNIRTMIFLGVVTNGALGLLYLFYSKHYWSDVAIDCQNQFFFTIAEVSLMDLAARATPRGCEGLGYSLILSMRNLSLLGADVVGSVLSDKYGFTWSKLVWINSGTTLLVLIFLPFLPRKIMMSRDQKQEPDLAEPTVA